MNYLLGMASDSLRETLQKCWSSDPGSLSSEKWSDFVEQLSLSHSAVFNASISTS